MNNTPRPLFLSSTLSLAALALAAGAADAATIQGGKHGGQNQGGSNSGGASRAPSPAPAPAPRPSPAPAPAPAPAPRPSPSPNINPGGNSGSGSVTPSRGPSAPPPAPSRDFAPQPSNRPSPVDVDRGPTRDPGPPPRVDPQPSRNPVSRPEPPTVSGPRPGNNYNPPPSYNSPEGSNRYNPPPVYNNPAPENNTRGPVHNSPPSVEGPPTTSNPGYDSGQVERPSYPRPSEWRIRYSDTGKPSRPETGTLSNGNNNTENNNGSSPRRPGSGKAGSVAPAPVFPGTSGGNSRDRYKNPSPRPAPSVPATGNPDSVTNGKPGRRGPAESPAIHDRLKNPAPSRDATPGKITKDDLKIPRVRHARAESIAKADTATAGAANDVLAVAGKAKSTSKASKAFVSGLFSGGAGAAACYGSSHAHNANFSWYNYINFGIGSPVGFSWFNYWNVHSYFSFQIGYSSCWSNAGYGFVNGSPWWWTGPAAYCGSYYGSLFYSPYYHPHWGAFYHPSYFYTGTYYPYDYYPVTYYPAYVDPIIIDRTQYIYYPEVHESTVYVPYETEKRYETPAEPAPLTVEARSGGGLSTDSRPPVVPPSKSAPAPTPSAMLADRYVSLGDIYFRLGHYDRAVESYERAVTQDSRDPNLHFILSDALFAVGNYHAAAAEILTAISLDPGLVESTADKRDFYGIPDDYNLHIASLESWVKDHSDDADAWLVLGYNQYFRKDYKLARVAFDRARELANPVTRRAAELFLAVVDVRLAEAAAAVK